MGGNIVMIIGSALLLMVGFFELNRRDQGMLLLHFVGFAGASIVIPIATFFQVEAIHNQNRSKYEEMWVMPICCMCISWPCLFAWSYFNFSPSRLEQFERGLAERIEHGGSCQEYLEEVRPKVNRFALKCLILEWV